MATRAIVQEQNIVTQQYLVPATKTTTKGLAVIFSGADDQVEVAGADSDVAIGIAKKTCVAGEYCQVALFAYAVVEAVAGTGGVTRGKKQVLVADGFTDAPADNGATTPKPTYGFALQTAAAGEKFGLALSGPANRTTT
jgi:hypothetical protein